jgi:alpha-ribazole phosphatase
MTITDLVLLRHGAPELTGTLLGRTDSTPTAEGIARCVEAAGDIAFARVITSPLRRAQAAANAIATTSGADVRIDPRWRELDFGEWDGRTVAELTPDHEAALTLFWLDPDLHPPPGGERWSALRTRVCDAIANLIAEGDERPTLVVAHGGSIRAAVSVLCGFDFAHTMRLELPYAAALRLRVFADAGTSPTATIRSLNG